MIAATDIGERSRRNPVRIFPHRRCIACRRSELAAAQIGTNLYGYAYDTIGNRLWSAENTYTANNLNQYTSILCDSQMLAHPSGSATPNLPSEAELLRCISSLREPIHDVDGNLTFDGVFTYAYDADNRLASVSSNGFVLVTNQYDYKGRRVRKTTPTSETTFIYDDWNLIYEREVAGSVTNETYYYWGKDLSGTLQGAGGVGGLLYLKRNGTIYVPHHDANGTIVRYTDTVGNVVAGYIYGAFGNTLFATGTLADTFHFRYSTKYYDLETGLYYYLMRFYHPPHHRWLNRDPIGERGGLNLYGFCNNAQMFEIDAIGYSVFDYLPFTSTVLSAIESYVGHVPGSSTADYSFVSPRDCQCNIVEAEEQCKNNVKKESLQYIADVLSSAAIARAVDIGITILTLRADPRVSAVFAVDGAIGFIINARAYAKIMEGANKAKSENCSCSQYGY